MKKKTLLRLSDSALDEAVKIQGTVYDRKRVLTDAQVLKAAKMVKAGKSVLSVAKAFGVDPTTIRYNTDKAYREAKLAIASGKHTGVDTCDFADRVAYKRNLIENNKNVTVVL